MPIGPLCLAVMTYFGRATGAISGLRMVADAPADQTGLTRPLPLGRQVMR